MKLEIECCTYAAEVGVQVVRKELAVHKEMVAELRQQLADKDTELQVRIYIHCKNRLLYVRVL